MTALFLILVFALIAWALGLRILLRLASLGAIALGLAVALDAGLTAALPLILVGVVGCRVNRQPARGGTVTSPTPSSAAR